MTSERVTDQPPASRPGIEALEVLVTAKVVSFRNPLYAAAQVCLPCPPPSTVGGLLAAAAGGWDHVGPGLSFAMAFTAAGEGTDLETYHPLDAKGRAGEPVPRDRQFLADARLRLWLFDELDKWESRLRRPAWPTRLGRSQDLAAARTSRVVLRNEPGYQRGALIPADHSHFGTLLQLPAAISIDRSVTRWESYRFRPARSDRPTLAGPLLEHGWSTRRGDAVVPLRELHPDHAVRRRRAG